MRIGTGRAIRGDYGDHWAARHAGGRKMSPVAVVVTCHSGRFLGLPRRVVTVATRTLSASLTCFNRSWWFNWNTMRAGKNTWLLLSKTEPHGLLATHMVYLKWTFNAIVLNRIMRLLQRPVYSERIITFRVQQYKNNNDMLANSLECSVPTPIAYEPDCTWSSSLHWIDKSKDNLSLHCQYALIVSANQICVQSMPVCVLSLSLTCGFRTLAYREDFPRYTFAPWTLPRLFLKQARKANGFALVRVNRARRFSWQATMWCLGFFPTPRRFGVRYLQQPPIAVSHWFSSALKHLGG